MLLEGLRVIDVGSYVAGPAAATVMADFGADVIKIEPLTGDPYRTLLSPMVRAEYPNFFWDQDARSKRSLAIDFTTASGRAVLEKLIGNSDVVLTNYRPRLLERLRLRYEDVRAIRADVIYAQVNSYGMRGNQRDRTGFDATAWWAASGLMDHVRTPGVKPGLSAPGMGDHPTAMSLFGGIMAALYRREKTGEGAHVHTSLVANGVWSHSMTIQGALVGFDLSEQRSAEDVELTPLATMYETADGRWLLLCILNPDKEWPRLLRALGHPEWDEDARFHDPAERMMNGPALYRLLAETFATNTSDHWARRLDTEQITWSLANRLSDVLNDEDMYINDVLTPVPPGRQLYAHTVNSPLWIEGVDKRPPQPAPEIGEHSREILAEIGLGEDEIEALIEAGTVRDARADTNAHP